MVKRGIDLNFGELFNACFEKLPDRPSLETEFVSGYVYFNTTSGKFEGYNGESWIELGVGDIDGTSINGVTLKSGKISLGSGSAVSVAICKGTDIDTGIYFDALNTISIAAAGVDALHMNGNSSYVKTAFLLSTAEQNLNGATAADAEGSFKYSQGDGAFVMKTSSGSITIKQDSGWTLPTGTASRAGFNADSDDFTGEQAALAKTVKALMDHLMTTMGIFVA